MYLAMPTGNRRSSVLEISRNADNKCNLTASETFWRPSMLFCLTSRAIGPEELDERADLQQKRHIRRRRIIVVVDPQVYIWAASIHHSYWYGRQRILTFTQCVCGLCVASSDASVATVPAAALSHRCNATVQPAAFHPVSSFSPATSSLPQPRDYALPHQGHPLRIDTIIGQLPMRLTLALIYRI